MTPTSLFFLAIIFHCDAFSLPVIQNPNTLCSQLALGSCSLFSSCCRRQCNGRSDISCVTTNGHMQATCRCQSAGPGDSHATNGPPDSRNSFTSGNRLITTRSTIRATLSTTQPPASDNNQYRNCGRRGGVGSNFRSGHNLAGTETRIVGGNQAQPHSWPWQASLRQNDEHICGGSVIDHKHVLTAAHCVENSNTGSYNIVLGIQSLHERTAPSQVFDIDKITIHPNYDGLSYDAAILTLNRSISFSNTISPVCIPQGDATAGSNCYVTGWGKTQGTGNKNHLRQVLMPVLSRKSCSQLWGDNFDSSMICAGTFDRDACSGDSGGPLVCPLLDGRYELQGIVSFGPDTRCAADKPGVYTRVYSMRDWINDETGSV